MMSFLYLLVTIVLFLGMGFFLPFFAVYFFKQSNKEKKSPVIDKLLRSPGETLRHQIDEISDIMLQKIVFLVMIPVWVSFSMIIQPLLTHQNIDIIFLLIVFLIMFPICIWQSIQLYKLLSKRKNLRLGYDCELAVAQALCPLYKLGYEIYHDFKASDNFNIDHIAVGPHGVFSIETKGRSRSKENKDDNWKIQYTGTKLIFPNGYETQQPIKQAKYQAKWLFNWIKEVTGEQAPVIPVLAIPGWYINFSKNNTDVKVSSGNFEFFTKGRILLTEKQIKRIAYQVKQKCRVDKEKEN